MAKSKEDSLNELEPFRSEIVKTVYQNDKYRFSFKLVDPYRKGELIVTDLISGNEFKNGYTLTVQNKKTCQIRLDLRADPFNYPHFVDVDHISLDEDDNPDFESLESKLQEIS